METEKAKYPDKKLICQYDEKGKFIQSFDTVEEAALKTGFDIEWIKLTLRWKYRTYMGYYWKKSDNTKDILPTALTFNERR